MLRVLQKYIYMKNLIKSTLIVAMIAFLGSCAAGPSRPGGSSTPKDYTNYNTLGDALRTIGGIQVSGSGTSLQVSVRGGARGASMTGSNLALFVIDGVSVGQSYASAAAIVRPDQIESIRVLSGTSAITRYGQEANAGAIEIRTKNK